MRDNIVQSVDRAMYILNKLSENKKGMGISEISKVTGLHKSTVHRLLSTLMKEGYVEKIIDSDNYILGVRILHLASTVLERMDVRTISRPYLRKLADITGEVVHLSILDKDKAIYIDKVESNNMSSSVRMDSQIGKSVPLYCTAAGKVLLSNVNEGIVKSLVNEDEMKPFTKNTIVDISIFLEELKKTKINGYAIDDVEHEEGIKCIAAPIYDRSGNVVAALSISSIIIHMNEERMAKIIKDILQVTTEISKQLGYLKG